MPVTQRAFFVLTVLADGPRHGYGLAGEVAELSQGRVRLKGRQPVRGAGPARRRGLIEPDQEEARGGRLRRYYRLTQNGRRAPALGPPPGSRRDGRGAEEPACPTARMVRGETAPDRKARGG